MSIQFPSPMNAKTLSERAAEMQAEAEALIRIAQEMETYEKATGRTVFLTEAGAVHEPILTTLTAQPPTSHSPSGIDAAPAAEREHDQPQVVALPPLKVSPRPRDQKSSSNRPGGKLDMAERRIVKHVERLPNSLCAADGVRLVEMLTAGSKLEAAAEVLGKTEEACLAHWRAMIDHDDVSGPAKARGNGPTIDGQRRLLNALHYLVEVSDG